MNIALIGAGNLSTQLGIELTGRGQKVVQVYSREGKNAMELAAKLKCPFTDDLSGIDQDADLYIVAVTDNAIESILAKVSFGDNLVVHTSGGISMEIFKPYCKNYGVLYPLQTFSKEKRVDFKDIPVCIEANTEKNLEMLIIFCESISEKVMVINSENRIYLHLAAVFACNFVNHFYSISEMLLEDKRLDFELLKPLIKETASKVISSSPKSVQTGPAVRNDKEVMNRHLELLKDHKEWSELYKLISENIYKIHNNKNGIY